MIAASAAGGAEYQEADVSLLSLTCVSLFNVLKLLIKVESSSGLEMPRRDPAAVCSSTCSCLLTHIEEFLMS